MQLDPLLVLKRLATGYDIKCLRVAAPETNCQGLFNQIHKKATKKCQKQILAPDTFADGLFAPA